MGVAINTGIFSGLDTGQIISDLMALERQPLEKLSLKKANYTAQISSYGTLSSSLSSLRSSLSSLKSSSFLAMSTTSSDETVFTATATSSASEGTHNIKVNNLATSQSIYSEIFTLETTAVADLTTYSTQKLKIQVGSGNATEITIDSSNNTLTGIRDAINSATSEVNASVVQDSPTTGYRLILSVDSPGASSRVTVKVDEDNDGTYEESAEIDTTGLSKLAFNATYDSSGLVTSGTTNMTQSQAAVDASLTVDGLSLTRNSNTISDIITGVTLTLLDDSGTATPTLSIAKDFTAITDNVSAFVDAYNSAVGLARALSVSVNGQSTILSGDSTARTIIAGLRSEITKSYDGKSVASLGLSHDTNGLLSLDSSILQSALDSDVQEVIDTFDSMATSMKTITNDYTDYMIPTKKNGLTTSIERIDDRVLNLERSLLLKEESLQKKFTAMEGLLSQLQQSGDFLSQQMESLQWLAAGMSK